MPDSWQRIWNGNSVDLASRIPNDKIDCIITDPPFGVNNQSNMAVTDAGKKYARKIANDEDPEQAIAIFQRVMSVLLPKVKPVADIYVFTSYQVLKEWLVMCDDLFKMWEFSRDAIIWWEKDGPGMGDLKNPWGMGSEAVLFYGRGTRPDLRVKRRNATLHVPQVRPDKLIHPHEKPLKLLEMFLKASTNPGDFVVDPFSGSGSLARAARNCNRNALCIELDEHNYNLAKAAYDSTDGDLFN